MCTTKKGAFLGSGITLIILSILMIIWQIANDVLLGLLSLLVLRTVGYWAGVLYLVVGILSAVAGRDLKKCPVIGAFVMSIIAIVIAGLGSLIIHGQTVAVVAIYSGAAAQNNQQQAVLDSVGALWIPPLIISVLCFIFNLVILVLTSTVICCGSKDDQAV